MENVRFAVYIDVEGPTPSTSRIYEAIAKGLEDEFRCNDMTFDVQVYMVPPVEMWQPGHLNTQTAVNQRKVNE